MRKLRRWRIRDQFGDVQIIQATTARKAAVECFNYHRYNRVPHPRVQKMYRDDPVTKKSRHIGYVVGGDRGLWMTVCLLVPLDEVK